MKDYGIDYASVDGNKPPDTEAAKWGGTRFVYQRAYGDGFRNIADPHFKRDRASWRAAGIPHGGYLIMCWPTKTRKVPEPEAQAQGMIDTIGELQPGELPPCLDVEFGATKGRVGSVLSARQAIEWVERAHKVLERVYGIVTVYTSARVWQEDLFEMNSPRLSTCPLWIKTGYWNQYRQPFDLEHFTQIKKRPQPWYEPGTAGVWMHQFQGDCKGAPGFSSTTDVNWFLTMRKGEISDRVKWVQEIIGAEPDGNFGPNTELKAKAWQAKKGLVADGVIGAKSFAALCQAKASTVLASL